MATTLRNLTFPLKLTPVSAQSLDDLGLGLKILKTLRTGMLVDLPSGK